MGFTCYQPRVRYILELMIASFLLMYRYLKIDLRSQSRPKARSRDGCSFEYPPILTSFSGPLRITIETDYGVLTTFYKKTFAGPDSSVNLIGPPVNLSNFHTDSYTAVNGIEWD